MYKRKESSISHASSKRNDTPDWLTRWNIFNYPQNFWPTIHDKTFLIFWAFTRSEMPGIFDLVRL